MSSKRGLKASKPRRDDFPAIGVSRLRALRAITPDMKHVRLELEGLSFHVNLAHTKLSNGGGWSYFVCPSCARLAQTLRLLEGRLVCRRCDGLLARCQMQDKAPAIKRLLERLSQPSINRRGMLELSLRRKLIVERERRMKGWRG